MTAFRAVAYLTTIAALVVVFVGVGAARRIPARASRLVCVALLATYTICLVRQPLSWWSSNLLVLAVSVVLGGLLGKAVRSEAALVPFLVAAAVADTFSATGGLTAAIIDGYVSGRSLLLRYLSISVPFADRIVPVVGVGDLLFASAIMHALTRLEHRPLAVLLVPTAGLVLALTVAFLTGFVAALPSLAAVTVAYLLVRGRRTIDASSAPASCR